MARAPFTQATYSSSCKLALRYVNILKNRKENNNLLQYQQQL